MLRIALLSLLLLIAAPHVMPASDVTLVNFTDVNPVIEMQTVDDPVMGGKSSSSCHHSAGDCLVWEGTVRKVDFLNAPGFCNLRSKGSPDLSVLQNTHGIAFHVKSGTSKFFHPMGINIQNGLRTARGIPITYSAPAKEVSGGNDGVVKLHADWTDFTASAYGQPVDNSPPLDANGLSRANQFGMSTYQAHQEGTFHMEILSVVGLVSSGASEEEEMTGRA